MKITWKPEWDLILPLYPVNYSHYNTICSFGVYLQLVLQGQTLSTGGFICSQYLLTVDMSRIGWWVSFPLCWPLIKLFPQAWWKRESSFRGDWATATEGDPTLCEALALLCLSAGGETSAHILTLPNGDAARGGETHDCPHPTTHATIQSQSTHRSFICHSIPELPCQERIQLMCGCLVCSQETEWGLLCMQMTLRYMCLFPQWLQPVASWFEK